MCSPGFGGGFQPRAGLYHWGHSACRNEAQQLALGSSAPGCRARRPTGCFPGPRSVAFKRCFRPHVGDSAGASARLTRFERPAAATAAALVADLRSRTSASLGFWASAASARGFRCPRLSPSRDGLACSASRCPQPPRTGDFAAAPGIRVGSTWLCCGQPAESRAKRPLPHTAAVPCLAAGATAAGAAEWHLAAPGGGDNTGLPDNSAIVGPGGREPVQRSEEQKHAFPSQILSLAFFSLCLKTPEHRPK